MRKCPHCGSQNTLQTATKPITGRKDKWECFECLDCESFWATRLKDIVAVVFTKKSSEKK